AAESLQLEPWIEPRAPLEEETSHGEREGDIAGTNAFLAATARVHAPHDLGVDAESRTESKPPPVDTPERDPASATRLERLRDPPRGFPGVVRKAERPWKHARAAARDECERHRPISAVQR